jgi:hypothetical protein
VQLSGAAKRHLLRRDRNDARERSSEDRMALSQPRGGGLTPAPGRQYLLEVMGGEGEREREYDGTP